MHKLTRGVLIALAFSATSAVADSDLAHIEAASVERMDDGRVVVRWRSVPANAPIDVYVGTTLVSNDDRDGTHELTQAQAKLRPLVRVTAPHGATLVTAERVLPLEGGRNFRDLGGYSAQDGRRVKWGKVYRSGTMAQLTDADYELLSTLGIRVICDFRANEEREREPTLWRTSTKPTYWARDYRTDESSLKTLFGDGAPTAHSIRAAMIQFYGDTAYEHAESYRAMFKSLAQGEAPLAFNCSAGKDRTGVAAALLLTMLGVPRETVIEDYALSERVVDYQKEFAADPKPKPNADGKPDPWSFVAQLPAEVRAPLMRSEPDYIRAALASIEQREGSIEAYFENVLSISKKEQARIRELLLESGTS